MNNEEKNYYYGFDYLRAFFSVVIVAWHAGAFSIFAKYPAISYLTTNYLGLLAVPIFLQISLYLYVLKARGDNKSYFKKRLKTLSFLYLFWLFLNVMLTFDGGISSVFKDTKEFLNFIIGNHTVIYFLLSLILCTIISELFIRINEKYPIGDKFIALILLFSLGLMLIGGKFFVLINFPLGYANPFNFIPYVFSSLLIVRITLKPKLEQKNAFMFGFLLFLSFALTEWFVFKVLWHKNFESYNRISLVFLAILISFIFRSITRKPPRLITALSELSLGIYVTHAIILHYCRKFFEIYQISSVELFLIALFVAITVSIILKQTVLTQKLILSKGTR